MSLSSFASSETGSAGFASATGAGSAGVSAGFASATGAGSAGVSAGFASATGAGTLSFAWRISSEQNYDKCFLYVDGVQKAVVHGEVAWANVSVAVAGDGEHLFEWRYKKDGSVSRGSDCVWLDDVSWRAS